MKKRFFAVFLAVCLVATLLPAGVLAADVEYVYVGGVELASTDGGTVCATTDSKGKVTKLESAEGATITWDGETLTLNGATIKGNSGKGIVYRDGDLTIWLEGTNKIGEEDIYSAGSGIYVKGSLTVTGSGTLGVLGLNSGITAGNATFSGGTVNATATIEIISDSAPMGIYAGSVTVDGGKVTAVAEGNKGCGIYTDGGGVTVTDGSVTAEGKANGIQTQGNVNISGGKVVAEGGNVGIFVALHQGFSIKITGGEVTVTGGSSSFYENVTIEPEKDTAITIEYGASAGDYDKIETVVYGGETYTYNWKHHYFHSSTETDISKFANITVGGVGLYGTDYRIAYAKTDGEGKVTTEGATASDYNIKWDGTTLTLKDAMIEVDYPDYGIEYKVTSPITIQLEGKNTVTGSYGIRTSDSRENLTISGSGTLNVNGDGSHAIYAAKNIEISDATVNAKSTGAYSDGIYTYGGDIIINSGKVTVECADIGLNANNNVSINGGTVSVDSGGYGVDIIKSLTIRGGTVTIEADTQLIYATNRTVTIDPQGGAEITVKAGDSKGNAVGITIPDDGIITDSVSGAKYFHSETSGGTPPTIAGVTVEPDDATVEVGETQRFTAEVKGTGYYNESVVWTVSGNNSAGTFISSNGVLNIAADETAKTLTVKATAVGNSGKYATATVTVTQPATITGVTVIPATATVEAGRTQEFTATVSGTGNFNQEVTWSVEGNESDDTTIVNGLLTVATDETATTLAVTATAKGDGITSATATVTVTPPATITGVIVTPATTTVEAGGTQRFTATVTGTGGVSQEVTWTVSGSESEKTTIENGLLTVAAGETAKELTVTATANGDKTKSATATVTVTQPATITGVTVEPNTANVEAGETQQFTAKVEGTGDYNESVTWTVSGNESDDTTIENGVLTVATDETATTLTVTATAVGDGTTYGTATVTVTQPATITGVTVTPATATVEAGGARQFTAKVEGTGDVSKEVTWSVSGSNAGTTISENGLLTVAADETAKELTVTATANGDGITSATATVTVTQPATITDVTVTPATATVEAGETQQFTATVIGTGNVSKEVTWSVSGSNAGTTISETGLLTVAAGETAATLTVTATAVGDNTKSGTAKVTVTQPDPDEPWNPGGGTTGNRYCYLTFETRGGSEIDSLRVKLGETVSLDEYLSERAGFDFAGWYSDDSFAERVNELYMNGSKTVYAAWEPFDDAGRGDWFYDSVVYVYENGLMDGVSDTLFDPDGTVTRAQLVTMLWRLDGEPSVNYALPFTDVSGGEWYAEAVRWAAGEGIVNGVSETEFAPNAAVTREQLAAILHRYAQHKGYDVSIGESTNILSYSDFASISEYAISAMQWVCGEGIITGVTESTLEPQGTATRAQSAAILMRFLEG